MLKGAPWTRLLPPLAVFALFSAISFAAASVLQRAEDRATAELVHSAAEGMRGQVAARLEARMQSLVRLARRWSRRPPDRETWEFEAGLVHADYPGFQVIEWLAPDHRVRWLVPSDEAHRKALGLYVPFEPRRREAMERAIRTRDVALTRPIDLVIGGRGFLGFAPILGDGDVDSFILGVFRAEKLFDAVLEEIPGVDAYSLTVFDGDETLYARGGTPAPDARRFEHRATLRPHGVTWTLVVHPREDLLAARATGVPAGAIALGHALAGLLALTLFFSGRARERARRAERAEAELQAAVRELEAFGYTVSHDLRAPLRAMAGFTGFLLEEHGPSLDAQARDYLRRIDAASRKMDVMIRELLTYSQLSRLDVRRTRVGTAGVVREAVDGLATDARARQADVAVEDPLPDVLGDPLLLSQCVMNLLSNALKFVPAGRAPRVRVRAEPRGARVRLWVEDNGLGIEPAHRERIFRVFERLHKQEDYPGTGIGLAIVQRAAERMAGAVGLESVPGEGSRFWLELDRA
jgi:signal transduction histidine kinase